MGLPRLPDIEIKAEKNRSSKIILSSNNQSFKLPNLNELALPDVSCEVIIPSKASITRLPSFQDIREFDNNVLTVGLSDDLVEEYHNVKKSYGNLIQMFEQSIEREMNYLTTESVERKSNLNNYSFDTLEGLEESMKNGAFNLSEFSIVEIDNLIRDLNRLEHKLANRDLSEYNLKSLDDFQLLVNSGELNLANYKMEDINELISGLSDEIHLELTDYKIKTFGKTILAEVQEKVKLERIKRLKVSKDTNEVSHTKQKTVIKENCHKEEISKELHVPDKKIGKINLISKVINKFKLLIKR